MGTDLFFTDAGRRGVRSDLKGVGLQLELEYHAKALVLVSSTYVLLCILDRWRSEDSIRIESFLLTGVGILALNLILDASGVFPYFDDRSISILIAGLSQDKPILGNDSQILQRGTMVGSNPIL